MESFFDHSKFKIIIEKGIFPKMMNVWEILKDIITSKTCVIFGNLYFIIMININLGIYKLNI